MSSLTLGGERVIYGKPIECSDFLQGVVDVAHTLVAGAESSDKERFMRFTVSKGRKEWRERFNYDVGAYFGAMYAASRSYWGPERSGR